MFELNLDHPECVKERKLDLKFIESGFNDKVVSKRRKYWWWVCSGSEGDTVAGEVNEREIVGYERSLAGDC